MSLKDMVSGALEYKFQHAFNRVMENMQDENTPYKDKRQIIITMTFVQNEQRDDVICDIAVKEKLAMQSGLQTHFSVAKDLQTGKVMAEEYGGQLKGQLSMLDVAENASVDMETGEVIEDIIDIRKVR